jgi:hypothetical protein
VKPKDVLKPCLTPKDSIKENDFHGAFEAWKKHWVGISKDTIFKEIASKIE